MLKTPVRQDCRSTAAVITVAALLLGVLAACTRAEPAFDEGRTRSPDHSVTVRYTLPGDGLGETDVVEAIHALEDRLEKAITDAGVGEFDGNELGGGEAVLFAYGPDATKLFAVMEPELRAFSPRPAYAILRFGAADDAAAVEKRIDL